MFYSLDNDINEIIEDNEKKYVIAIEEDKKILIKKYNNNILEGIKCGYLKKKADNVFGLLEVGDLVSEYEGKNLIQITDELLKSSNYEEILKNKTMIYKRDKRYEHYRVVYKKEL